MTLSSNQTFFAVNSVGPQPDAGWTVEVLDYQDLSTPVAVINEYSALSVGPQLNAPGAGSVTLDADSPFWTTKLINGQRAEALLDREYVWGAYENGILRFQWLGTNVEEHFLEDDETRVITVSGPGIAQVLTWGCNLPKYFPPAKENPVMPVWWQLPVTWSAMRAWIFLFQLCKIRGTLRFVTAMFTDMHDSGGRPWDVVQSPETTLPGFIAVEPGANLLDLLNIHSGQDASKQFAQRAEWFMWPGFRLDVRQTIGTHRETSVIFFEAATPQKERVRARADVANYILAVDALGSSSLAVDAASVAAWHQREQLQNRYPNLTDKARRDAIAQTNLQLTKDEKSQWTIKVPYDEPGRKPFVDYNIGDWIGIAGFTESGASTRDAYRVMAIVVSVSADALPEVELTLQSVLDLRLLQLERKITSIVNTVGTGGEFNLPNITPLTVPPVDGRDLGISPTQGIYSTPQTGTPINVAGDTVVGLKMFIQHNDPGFAANVGDLWLQT